MNPIEHVTVNRAAVLTLWAAVVARRLGFDREIAAGELDLGRILSSANSPGGRT
jgi:hypothetical protein